MNKSRRRWHRVSLALVVSIVCVLTSFIQGNLALADAACRNGVYLIFARGSQPTSKLNDLEASTFSNSVRSQLTPVGLNSSFAELGDLDGNGRVDFDAYPAIHGIGWMLPPGYYGSVDMGVAELINHLNSRVIQSGCQQEAIVLGGYSQGADVIGAALQDPRLHPEVLRHIAYFAAYGDPRHNSGSLFACSSWVKGNALCGGYGPPLAPRQPYTRAGFEGKTGSWCDREDGVCSHNWLLIPGSHASGVYASTWIPASASTIAAAARTKLAELNGSSPAVSSASTSMTADRTILHGSNGSLWVMAGGAKFYFGSMQEFYGLGYSTAGMVEVSTEVLATIPTTPRNGTVLRSGGGQLYVVAGGAKFPFGSMAEYYGQGYANNQWINVPQWALDQIGDVPGNKPIDGTVIQSPSGALSVVVGGVKFQFGSMTEYYNLGYSDSQIVRVSGAADSLANASTATPTRDGTVLRGGGGQLYVVAGGAKFLFGSMDEFYGQTYAGVPWFNVPQGPLNAISDAPGRVPGNGTAVLRPDGAIFVIAGGVRWYVSSMDEFHALGYSDSRIVRVSTAPLDGIYGADASHPPADGTLLQGTDAAIWVMQGGVRKQFGSMTQFAGLGYSTAHIVRVPDAVLARVPSDGYLS